MKILTKNNFIIISVFFIFLKISLSYNYLKQVLYYYSFMINLFIFINYEILKLINKFIIIQFIN